MLRGRRRRRTSWRARWSAPIAASVRSWPHEIVFRAAGSSESTRRRRRAGNARMPWPVKLRALFESLHSSRWDPTPLPCSGEPGDRRGRCLLARCSWPISPPSTTRSRSRASRSPWPRLKSAADRPAIGTARTAPAASARRGGRRAREGGAAAGGAGRASDAGGRGRAAQDRGELIYAYLWQIAARSDPARRRRRHDSPRSQSLRQRERPGLLRALPQGAERRRTFAGLVDESRAEIAYLDQLATLIAQAPGSPSWKPWPRSGPS